MSVQQLTTREQEDSLIASSKVLIIFFGSKNCGHCVSMKPVFTTFSQQYPSITFACVEVTDVDVQNISAYPTFVFYKNGKVLGTITGADKNGIEKKLREIM